MLGNFNIRLTLVLFIFTIDFVIRIHYEKHPDFNLKTDKIVAKSIKNFELFKEIALKYNKFINKNIYQCPIIHSKHVSY